MGGSGSGSCPVADSGISDVEPSGTATTVTTPRDEALRTLPVKWINVSLNAEILHLQSTMITEWCSL